MGADTLDLTEQPDILVTSRRPVTVTDAGERAKPAPADADQAVAALYREHAVGLLGDSVSLTVAGGEQVVLSPEGKQVILRHGAYPAGVVTQYATTILPGQPLKGSISSPKAHIQTVTQLLWTNASGSVLIVSLPSPEIDVLDNGRLARLPATMPDNPLGIAW